MNRRLELQAKLEELLGSDQVYYMPPENIKMSYPSIVYSLADIDKRSANNTSYKTQRRYQLVIMDKRVDNSVIDKILELPMSSYSRSYKANNLNHDVIDLYY